MNSFTTTRRSWLLLLTGVISALLLLAVFALVGRSAPALAQDEAPLEMIDDEVVTEQVNATADLQIAKSGPPTVTAGSSVTYVLAITNATGAVLPGVLITDTWNTQVFTGLYETDGTVVQVVNFLLVTSPVTYAQFSLAPLPPNSTGYITMFMSITPSAMPRLASPVVGPTILGNSVVITTSTPGVSANNSNVQTMIVGPLLRLTKTYTPTLPRIGRLLTYTFKLENVMRSDAIDGVNVTVTERLPNNTIFWAAYPPELVTYDPAARAVDWLLPTLPVSDVAYLTFTVQVSPSMVYGSVSNPATNCSTRADGMPFAVACAAGVNAQVDDMFEKAGLTVSPPQQSGAISSTFPNRIMTYTVTVYNPFTETVTGLIVTDTLPTYNNQPASTFQYLNLVSASGPLPTVVASTTQAVAWSLPAMPGWGVYTFTFRVLVPPQMYITDNATSRTYQNRLNGNYAGIALATNDGGHDNSMKVSVVPQIQTPKTVNPSQQIYGFPVTYTLTVSNSGPTTIRDIVLTDTLPCGFIWDGLVSGAAPTSIMAGGRIIAWGGITLTPYAQTTLAVFRATVIGTPGTTCFNTVSGYSPDTYIVRRTNLAPVLVLSPFGYNKSVQPTSVVLGGQVVYAVSEFNLSPVPATMASFTDVLPKGFYYNGSPFYFEVVNLVLQPRQANSYQASFGVNVISTTVACDSLPSNVPQVPGTLQLEITDPPELSGVWVNAANAASLQVRPQAQAYQTLLPAAVLPGDVVTFTITLSNNTGAPISQVRVTDTLPTGFVFGGMLSGAPPQVVAPPNVFWYDQVIPANSTLPLVFTVTAPITVNNYTNLVKAASTSDGLICIPRVTAPIAVKAGIVEMNKSASPNLIGPLGLFTYDISLNNIGPYTVAVGIFTETLPGVTGYPWKFVAMQSGDPAPVATRPIVWHNLEIGAGKTMRLRFQVRAESQVGTYTNLTRTAALAGQMTGTVPARWTLRTVSNYNNAPLTIRPGVGIAKDAWQEVVMAGQTVNYTITLVNVSGNTVSNIRITDTLPANFTWDGLISGDTPVSIDPPIWSVSSLANGATKLFVFRARVAQTAPSGVRYNRVAATAAGTSIAPTGDTAPVEVIGIPTLLLSKAVAPNIVAAGRDVTYTLTLSNADRFSAVTAHLTDTLPPSITFAAMIDGPNPVATGPLVVWDNLTVPANTEQQLIFRATVAAGAPPQYYYNQLDGYSPLLVFESTGPAAPLLVASTDFDVYLSKTDGLHATPIGSRTVYTLNYGQVANAFGFTVTDNIITDTFTPADYLIADAPGWNFVAPGVYTYAVGELASGASGFVTLALEIDNAIPAEYYVITNTAEIGGGRLPEVPEAAEVAPANNLAVDVNTIRGPDLAIVPGSITVAPAALRQGGDMTVLVQVINQGVDVALGPDLTTWFDTDLYIKPIDAPPPANPEDRYLGACPTPVAYCPDTLRSDQIARYQGGGLAPGETTTLTYTVKLARSGWQRLYFQADTFWGEPAAPHYGTADHGRMIEGNEVNNIYGPLAIFASSNIYLPLIRK